MLRELCIKNFVLLEDVRLSFDQGLNVLTGETGAGKSIVIDALGLLLGSRFRSDQVRQGAERCDIEGIWDAPQSAAYHSWRQAHGLEETAELVIRREGTPDGRSRAHVNDHAVASGTLEELALWLVEVHGQHEHQQILKPAVGLACLDRFGDLQSQAAALSPLYRAWRALTEELQAQQLSEQERLQRVDVYRFQLQEIDQASLRSGEEEDLSARLPELKNAERLQSLAGGAYQALYEEEGSLLERMGQLNKTLGALASLSASVEPLRSDLEDIQTRLQEAARSLARMMERWQADPGALDAALARLDRIARLRKKYGESVSAILERADSLRRDLHRLENVDATRQDLEKRRAGALEALQGACLELSKKRTAAARRLSEAVQRQLADLNLRQAVFRCTVSPLPGVAEGMSLPRAFSETGMDRILFEWSPNPGEGVQPLKAIVSGGEMSRLMLALKTVLAQADEVPTLIFDEVDAGIGGSTGGAVGKKLRGLSRHHQILCVSHLPQIAACAHAHFHVSKRVMRARTFAAVTRLDGSQRLEEMARLLGTGVTPASVRHAQELLAQNK